ncbi:uncharacterized protein LOC142325236 [Lycorma delicatula]|uniref:uncharacterized protein LOC142325236 n=1 Tax=Lycorma delicatula TaxID=130591 RepID=UPI003F511016
MMNFSGMSTVFLFMLLLGVALSAVANDKPSTIPKKCDTGPLPTAIKIKNCVGTSGNTAYSTCEFKLSEKVEIEVIFKSSYQVPLIETKAYLKNKDYFIRPHTLNEKYTADRGELYLQISNRLADLPLNLNADYVYRDSFIITDDYPLGEYEFKWSAEDDITDQDFICARLTFKIVQ